MAKHYKIDDEKKIIYADIMALTEKEEAEVAKFQKYGYVVENKVEKKVPISRLDDEYIKEYLEEDQEALKKYNKIKARPARDEEGNEKTYASGTVKCQGFNAGRNWFARTYPLDINVAITAIETAEKTEDLKEAFEEYEKKSKKAIKVAEANGKTLNPAPMTKEEYTKDFYWKKVFVKPAKQKKSED